MRPGQRLINDMLPDAEESKVNRCVKNAFDIWEKTSADKATQLIFCDLSAPKNDGTFNVYDDVREKLVAMGIPREEVAFIHEAGTETKKAELFSKVRSGHVRILLGSTPKLVHHCINNQAISTCLLHQCRVGFGQQFQRIDSLIRLALDTKFRNLLLQH